MAIPLRLLILEDNAADAELVLQALRRAGYDPLADRVETEQNYRDCLHLPPEIILADFSMPEFDSLRALEIMQARQLDIPFIIVSGTIGEERAVQVMQRGATDYVMKDRLGRLGPAVAQALARGRLKEEKLKAEQLAARLAAIVETSGNSIITSTLEGTVTSWNRAAEHLYGYAAHEILGKPISVLVPRDRRHADAPEEFRQNIEKLTIGEPIAAFETVRVRKDGRRVEVLLSISPIRDANGAVIGRSGIAVDITLRRRSERFLSAEHAVTRILVDSRNLEEAGPRVLQTIAECLRLEVAVLWMVDRTANLLRRTRVWHAPWAEAGFIKALSQKTALEPGMGIAGRCWSAGEPVWESGSTIDSNPTVSTATTREGLRGGIGLPMRQGTEIIGVIEFYNPDLREPDTSLIAALDNIACQISQFCEQKRSLEKLRISEEQFRNLVMALPAAVYTTDKSGLINLYNEHAVKLWGRRPELGKDRWCGARKLLRPDGAPLLVDEYPMAVTVRGGRGAHGEELIVERPDGSRRHVLMHPEPLRGTEGEIVGAVNMVIDITEMQQLEAQYRQSQKMEAAGQLAAGVAHDFNNLLTIIMGYGELVLSKLPADDPGRDAVAQICSAGERATSLTRQLLAFGRKQILAPVVLDLNSLLTEVQKMLGRLIGADIEVKTILEPGLGRVKIDPGQAEQIIMNLAVNARDAMPTGGRFTIQTCNTVLSELQARQNAELAPGPYALLSVSDTGSGMDKATMARIFEPFFTTKEVGKGTGLGLATVFGIIKQSGGLIEVDSALGSGTTFRIYFPRISETTPTKQADHGLVKVPRGEETVLLVEDDDALRELAQLILESSGYKVLSTRDGGEALQICHEFAGVIHLLLTDVVMPKMSGRQLNSLLVPYCPNMKVLYMSGYTDDSMIRHGIHNAETNFLAKPFTPVALAQKVRQVLDSTNGQKGTQCPPAESVAGPAEIGETHV